MAYRYLITGATGLIGSALTRRLAQSGEAVTVVVRNEAKARRLFGDLPGVSVAVGDIERGIDCDEAVDYIIHAAAPTDSSFFVQSPVETIDAIVAGTRSVLEFARKKQVKSIVNLSSMEMYGVSLKDEAITEDKQFFLDPLAIRSSYPMAKRLAETMAAAYATEFSVPVKTARLAQVLGKELLPDDNRVIAQFIKSAKDRTDITLATDGSTKQTYIGIDDAIDGIMTILSKGENGQSYNVANESTYCSIRELAEVVAREIANDSIAVIINASGDSHKYPPTRMLRLSSDRLRQLGWEPRVGLVEALKTLATNEGGK